MAEIIFAFYDYTLGGSIELLGGKAAIQARIGATMIGSGVYATYGSALAFELAMDIAVAGVVLTVLDPSNKWSGGLDEPRFHQHEHTQPKSFQNIYRPGYYGKDAQGTWG